MRKIPNENSRRTRSLAHRWPSGWSDLAKEASTRGFEPWVPRHSRLLTEWHRPNFAEGPLSLETYRPDLKPFSYAYVAAKAKFEAAEILEVAEAHSFLILDSAHRVAVEWRADESSAPASVVLCNAADAFVDWLSVETSDPEWVFEGTEKISASAQVASSVRCEPGVLIGPGAVIEDQVVLATGARIGAGARVGRGTRIGAYTVIGDHVQIGEKVQIGSHSSIGGLGFGLVRYPGDTYPRQRAHLGSVEIGEGVRMGSMVAIDRGVFDDTVIGAFTQIDNHVHIAHNCRFGEGNVLCAFVVFAGSTVVGSRNTFAGLVGSTDHIVIGDDVLVAAQTGISRNLQNGEQVKGYPPRAIPEALKIATLTTKLPDIYDRLRKLEKKVDGNS